MSAVHHRSGRANAGDLAHLWGHTMWALGLSLVAIIGGVAGRVRAYFFGGVSALVLTALFRSLLYLVEFWWVTLGVLGIVMLAVALTWERERLLLTATGHKVRETFSGWR